MSEIEDPNPLTGKRWTIEVAKVAGGRRDRIEATAEECAAAAKALELLSLGNLALSYQLRSAAGGRYRLEAELDADVVQACVVTLEPVPSHSHEATQLDLRADKDADDIDLGPIDIESTVEPGSLEDGRIDLGRLAFDLLSISLDPYPRKPGVELDDSRASDAKPDSPFAKLARLRQT
jgi:hypothetical protein